MRVSQFPPTMSAPLVLTQFVSILCSLESPLAALFFRLLRRVNAIQQQRNELAPRKTRTNAAFGSYLTIPGLRVAPPLPNPSGSVLAFSSEQDIFPCCCSVKQKKTAILIYNINKERGSKQVFILRVHVPAFYIELCYIIFSAEAAKYAKQIK